MLHLDLVFEKALGKEVAELLSAKDVGGGLSEVIWYSERVGGG